MVDEMAGANAKSLELELEWFSRVLATRLRLYFGEEGEDGTFSLGVAKWFFSLRAAATDKGRPLMGRRIDSVDNMRALAAPVGERGACFCVRVCLCGCVLAALSRSLAISLALSSLVVHAL